MTEQMPKGRVRLKGRELLDKYGFSMYRLRERGAASYPTIHKYMTSPEDVEYISGKVLYGILIDGFGLTHEQAAALRMGEVFEFIEDKENGDAP